MLKRLRLAYWAFMHPDNLTMLKFELQSQVELMGQRDSKESMELHIIGHRAWWYLQYLSFRES